MKKICWLLLVTVFLCGCSAEQTVERVYDELIIPAMAPAEELFVMVPEDAVRTALAGDDGAQLYFCEDYCLSLQTVPSGDLDRTVRGLCGFGTERLTMLETSQGGVKRWDWTWSCAGEAGDQVGRGMVLDDGDYHYCMTVLADEAKSGGLDEQWDRLFSAACLQR